MNTVIRKLRGDNFCKMINVSDCDIIHPVTDGDAVFVKFLGKEMTLNEALAKIEECMSQHCGGGGSSDVITYGPWEVTAAPTTIPKNGGVATITITRKIFTDGVQAGTQELTNTGFSISINNTYGSIDGRDVTINANNTDNRRTIPITVTIEGIEYIVNLYQEGEANRISYYIEYDSIMLPAEGGYVDFKVHKKTFNGQTLISDNILTSNEFTINFASGTSLENGKIKVAENTGYSTKQYSLNVSVNGSPIGVISFSQEGREQATYSVICDHTNIPFIGGTITLTVKKIVSGEEIILTPNQYSIINLPSYCTDNHNDTITIAANNGGSIRNFNLVVKIDNTTTITIPISQAYNTSGNSGLIYVANSNTLINDEDYIGYRIDEVKDEVFNTKKYFSVKAGESYNITIFNAAFESDILVNNNIVKSEYFTRIQSLSSDSYIYTYTEPIDDFGLKLKIKIQ